MFCCTYRAGSLNKTRLVVDRDKPRNYELWFMVLGLLLIMFYLNMRMQLCMSLVYFYVFAGRTNYSCRELL